MEISDQPDSEFFGKLTLLEKGVIKRKRFSVDQIVAVLKQAGVSMPVADILREVGISEQTFYRWKKQYAGLQSDLVRELKQPQANNARLE